VGKFTDISEALNLYSCSEFGIEPVQAFAQATRALDLSNWDGFKGDVLQAVFFQEQKSDISFTKHNLFTSLVSSRSGEIHSQKELLGS